jgi:predicted O-methyltransferase YrrM
VKHDEILELYPRFADDLRAVREQQAALYARHGWSRLQRSVPHRAVRFALAALGRDALAPRSMRPRLDDVEAEILYLLVRAAQPKHVVEISPGGGWSTTWLLSALRDNGAGELSSYDVVDRSRRLVPPDLAAGRWTLVLGDAKAAVLPPTVDFLLLDSEHTAEFARWYLAEVVPRVRPGSFVAVHDVFHTADPQARPQTGEDSTILDWLDRHEIPWTTAAPARNPAGSDQLARVRRELGFDASIHFSDANTMLFFRTPAVT